MDAVEFLKDWHRACRESECCDECGIVGHCITVIGVEKCPGDRLKNLANAVEQWAKDHPVKTRQSEFLKIAPLAPVSKQGVLEIRPCEVDKHPWFEECDFDCDKCCRAYWLQEVD